MIIAVDGPAASGKGTLARRLADHYNLAYLDTGRTYRAVAAALLATGRGLADEAAAVAIAEALDFARLADESLGAPEVGEAASRIAVMPRLREALVARQRAFADEAARADGGAVLDGRDIGTVVVPDAPVKLYVTATVEERAKRRALEVYGSGTGSGYERLLEGLRRRDARDTEREASPLRPARDAHVLDTTALSADATFAAAVRLVDEARAR